MLSKHEALVVFYFLCKIRFWVVQISLYLQHFSFVWIFLFFFLFFMEWHLEFHHSSFVNFCRCCLFMSYLGYSGWIHFSLQRNWFSLDCDFMVMWVVAKSIEQLRWSETWEFDKFVNSFFEGNFGDDDDSDDF